MAECDAALPEWLCPIPQEVMRDPVITVDGHTYERVSIQEWFDRGNTTSPLTNAVLRRKELAPNHALRSS